MAITKGVSAARIAAALRAGHDLFGENRVQEAEEKIAAVAELAAGTARWHLVGHLQSNKTRRAVTLFETVQSVDSLALAVRLDRLAADVGRRLSVYLQVNVDLDPAKTGFLPDQLRTDVPALLELPSLEPLGLMTVGELVTDPDLARPTFRALTRLSAEIRARDPRLGPGLSMGMSDDFEEAIEEGATCVRVGRAIFGERLGKADASMR